MAETTIKSVAPGAKLNLEGNHRIEGSIGKGAEVNVKNGNLTVAGNVDRGANINVQGGGLTVTGNVQGGSKLVVGANGTSLQTTAPRQPVSASRFAAQAGAAQMTMQQGLGQTNVVHRALQQGNVRAALIIMGAIGDDVNLQSSGRIKMKRHAGMGLVAKAVASIIGRALGEYANVQAGGGARFDSIGPMAEVRAGQTARIGRIADHAVVEAGKAVRAQAIGDGASVTAGTNIKSAQTSRSAHLGAPKVEAGTMVNNGIMVGTNFTSGVNNGIVIGPNATVGGLKGPFNAASGSTNITVKGNTAAIAIGRNAQASAPAGGTAIAVGSGATATSGGAAAPAARTGGPRTAGSRAGSPPKLGR